ncbi:hypothetical protein DPMN_145617 [Dreissena polymorpha]|uniref:Uncharacterized protein n=1 Tax=Dreissena polymorpha TaxID=45954 RepID=A0A9D4IXP5_DREPO|nr:hypothetical protein DPMN_145617 [Dreissena polymorpha]
MALNGTKATTSITPRTAIIPNNTSLEDWTIHVTFIVKNAPFPWRSCFSTNKPIFDLVQDIIGTNLLTKFNEDLKINVASRVKNSPLPGGHVFQPTGTIFELVQDIICTNLLTKFNEDRTINLASLVLIRQMLTPHNARRTKGDYKSLPSADCAQLS